MFSNFQHFKRQAGLTLVATLDGVLAAKKAEDYLLEELLEAAVTLVHCQLTSARPKRETTAQVRSDLCMYIGTG